MSGAEQNMFAELLNLPADGCAPQPGESVGDPLRLAQSLATAHAALHTAAKAYTLPDTEWLTAQERRIEWLTVVVDSLRTHAAAVRAGCPHDDES